LQVGYDSAVPFGELPGCCQASSELNKIISLIQCPEAPDYWGPSSPDQGREAKTLINLATVLTGLLRSQSNNRLRPNIDLVRSSLETMRSILQAWQPPLPLAEWDIDQLQSYTRTLQPMSEQRLPFLVP
jgi:hypothetical protein